MGLGHDNETGRVCSSHSMFDTMIKQSLDNVSDRLVDGIEAIHKQPETVAKALERNSDALTQVLANQADRRELCGKQNAKIENLEKSDDLQWKCIHAINKKIHMAIGAVILAQIIVPPICILIFKNVLKIGLDQ